MKVREGREGGKEEREEREEGRKESGRGRKGLDVNVQCMSERKERVRRYVEVSVSKGRGRYVLFVGRVDVKVRETERNR